MSIFFIILLSAVFTIIFIFLHLLFLYIFSLGKNIQILIPFILSNLICFFFVREMKLYNLFLNSFIINFSILIIYLEFLLLIKKGFSLAIISSFKKKKKLFYKELVNSYASGRGAKWLLLDRLNVLSKVKIIYLNKNMRLTILGHVLSLIFIALRKILSIRDFG